MPTHHDETLLERYQREHREFEGMNMSKAEELANKWCTAITTRAHVDAGNSMADELRRLSAINAELLEALKGCHSTLKILGDASDNDVSPFVWRDSGAEASELTALNLLLKNDRAAIAKAQGEQL